MKYAIIIPDGCADEPQESLGGKTPLEAANIPNMNAIARAGVVARASNVPAHLPAGSDVASLSLLGYDPNEYYTGRAPLEAAAMGVELHPGDWAVRCNLVCVEDQLMKSFTAGHISSEEGKRLLQDLQSELGEAALEFIPGVSYRNLLVVRGRGRPDPFSRDTRTTPPHDLTDQSICDDFPRGPGSDLLVDLMERSLKLFADHPVNAARRSAGKPAATNIWLWGLGQRPRLKTFREVYGKSGKMITAVDLLRGLGVLLDWDRIEVPGATGYLDTDYAAKGKYAVEAIPSTDVICVHIEATDEASHEGRADAKIEALEQIDKHIVGPVWEALQKQGDYRILVSPDHPTPLRTKTHSHGFVPAAMCGAGIQSTGAPSYNEPAAADSALAFAEGWRLMKWFLGNG